MGLVFLGIGYQLGTRASNPVSEEAEDENEDDDDELEAIADGDLGSISAGFLEPCKLVRLS